LYDLTPEQVLAVKQLSQEQVQYIKGYCTGYIRPPFKKILFANSDYAFQAPFLRTDVLSSQHSPVKWQWAAW